MYLPPRKPPVTPVKTNKELQTAYLSLFPDRRPSGHCQYCAGHPLLECLALTQ
jgi:hypothetical protein